MSEGITTTYRIGQNVPFHCLWYVILASYITSLVGAITTVELLHRRKSGHGWRGWLHLGACSISFGLVGIWCMHFVGNRAIELGDGKKEIQLYYDPGWTALSVFLPVIFLFFGFSVVERFNRTRRSLYGSLVVTGIAAGLAILGMHYIGNFGTTTYNLDFDPRYVIGAALIAIFACWAALTLFFHQREQWINSFFRRVVCAAILASAVCGMHWTAAAGTRYRLRKYYVGSESGRNTTLIVAISLCLVACTFISALALLIQRRRKQLADRAQHVVLASATFDADGRFLVTQEGLLPCQKITWRYNQRSFADEFNVAHPAFQWIFRVTYNWDSVADLVGIMRTHLRALGSLKDPSKPGSSQTRSPLDEDYTKPEIDYSVIFRSLFVSAAADLAEALNTSIHNLGRLWDDILMTGTVAADSKNRSLSRQSKQRDPDDVESTVSIPAPALFGRGQLLFVVRQIPREEASKLVASGYRFATLDQVGDIVMRSMQIPRTKLQETIKSLQDYTRQRDGLPNAGTFLALFALRPAVKPSTGSWDVLIPKDEPGHLPKVQLLPEHLKEWQIQILSQMEGCVVYECIEFLNRKIMDPNKTSERSFAKTLFQKIHELSRIVPEHLFRQSAFSSKPLKDYYQLDGDGGSAHGMIVSFCIIPDVHIASIKATSRLTYTPLSFFRCRQHVHKNSPDHSTLALGIHREFNEVRSRLKYSGSTPVRVLTGDDTSRRSSALHLRQGKRSWKDWWSLRSSSRRDSTVQPDHASDRELVSIESRSRTDEEAGGHTLGGIMVSQDIHIDADSKGNSVLHLKEMGVQSVAGVGAKEQPTFADQLFETTCARWRRA